MLAADVVADVTGPGGNPKNEWSGPSRNPPNSGWDFLPAHRDHGKAPAGGNEVFIDGSAKWIKAYGKMMFLHSWATDGSRALFFWQSDLGPYWGVPSRARHLYRAGIYPYTFDN